MLAQQGIGLRHGSDILHLGQRQVGQPPADTAHQRLDLAGKGRMTDRMGAGADAAEAVGLTGNAFGHQPGMGQLVTGRGAIFAIGRHVQHRPEPRLQRQ